MRGEAVRLWRLVVVRVEELDYLIDVVRDALELEWCCTVERDPWQCDDEYRRVKRPDQTGGRGEVR